VHGLIEFGNRVISGFVALSAVIAVVAAYRLRPQRPELTRLAWGLVAGTLAQVVLGGITVLADLHPIVVSVHFLVSMVLLWNAQTLWVRAGELHPVTRTRADWPARLQLTMAAVVLLTGTIVTGTGPNSGDSRADRLNFELETVARIHSVCVWLLIATVIFLAVRIVRQGGQQTRSFAAARWLVLAIVAQGALGYTQFALGVPGALVEAHVFGAIVVWSLSIAFFITLNADEAEAGNPTSIAPDRRAAIAGRT